MADYDAFGDAFKIALSPIFVSKFTTSMATCWQSGQPGKVIVTSSDKGLGLLL